MISIKEFRKELEKNGAINSKTVIDFAKKYKYPLAAAAVAIPASLWLSNKILIPYMAMQQGAQLKTQKDQLRSNISQLRSEEEQTRLLNNIALAVSRPEQPRMKIEPLA